MPSVCARTLPSAKETAGDETDKIPVSMELTFLGIQSIKWQGWQHLWLLSIITPPLPCNIKVKQWFVYIYIFYFFQIINLIQAYYGEF